MVDRRGNRQCVTIDGWSDVPDRRGHGRVGDLRVAVLGGGVAGLTVAAALRVRGRPCRVYERRPAAGPAGMGIVLSAEAVTDLADAGLDPVGTAAPLGSLGVELHRYRSYCPDGAPRDVLDIPAGWRGMPRSELVDALYRRVPAGTLAHDAELATLSVDPEGMVAEARLASGAPVRADIYLAADGAHSLARRTLYANWPQRPARVSELVGIARCPTVSQWAGNDLHKFHTAGVAIGILPAGGDTVGWFMQFDSERFPAPPDTVAGRREFAHGLVGTWAEPVPELLRATGFDLTHIWRPIDVDLVPQFHSGNLVLLGDAAHPLLPFTSQGVGAAVAGARDFAVALDESDSIPAALAAYSAACRSRCAPYVDRGRELTRAFLADETPLPLAVPTGAGPR
jgi:2-polyprenyl-6-methoxyphenol hydroxylase-like FAD-dependent oxidoreductase